MTTRGGWTAWAASMLAMALPAAGRARKSSPPMQPPGTGPAAPAATAPAEPGGKSVRPESRSVRQADRQEIEGRRVSRDPGGALWGWLRTLGALAIVVVLIFVVRWVLRRLGPGARARPLPEAVEVLARTNISARQQLLLVRLGRRIVLVGAGPEGMTTLSEVADPEEVAALLARCGAGRDREVGAEAERKEGGA